MGLEKGFRFNEEPWVRLAAIAVFSAMRSWDFNYQLKNTQTPTLQEFAIRRSIFVGLALPFASVGSGIWGGRYGGEFLAGLPLRSCFR
jgi:tellurite resistance protein TerC